MSPTALAALLTEQVETDWRLRARLAARAANEAGADLDLSGWRSRLDVAFLPDDDVVDYRPIPRARGADRGRPRLG